MPDSSENITALLPCPSPWCDSTEPPRSVEYQKIGSESWWHRVECSCGMFGPEVEGRSLSNFARWLSEEYEAEAIAAWNTRNGAKP